MTPHMHATALHKSANSKLIIAIDSYNNLEVWWQPQRKRVLLFWAQRLVMSSETEETDEGLHTVSVRPLLSYQQYN